MTHYYMTLTYNNHSSTDETVKQYVPKMALQ